MRAWPWLLLVGLALLLTSAPGVSAEGEAWAGLSPDVAAALAPVVRRLERAPWETGGEPSRGGGLRRLAKDRPRDTVVGVYPSPRAALEAVMWSREEIGAQPCPPGHTSLTLWMFAARPGTGSLVWAGQKLQTCVDPARPARPPAAAELSTEDRRVRALAATILRRLATE